MDQFLELKAFVCVVDSGSFVKAAQSMQATKAAMSRHLSDLEKRLGVRLLNRTTRRLSLTAEGQLFYDRSREILGMLAEAQSELSLRSSQVCGVLRINAPVTFGLLHLAPLWAQFREIYPLLEIDLTLSDRVIDLVEEGIDVAIRIAALQNSTLISRRISSTRMIVCASPEYIAKRQAPQSPEDLKHHEVIAYSNWAGKNDWTFEGPNGTQTVKTSPKFRTNSGDTCKVLALAGQGIILAPSFSVHEELKNKTLVELMPNYRSIELGVYVLYPSKKHVPSKVVALVDFLIGAFEKSPFEV